MRFVAVCLALAATACNRKADFRVEHPFAPEVKAEVVLGGTSVTTVSGAGEWSFVAPSVAYEKDTRVWYLPLRDAEAGGSDSLAVRVDSGCGPVEWCIGGVETDAPEKGPVKGRIGGRRPTPEHTCMAVSYDLYYDNRGGAAATLSIGPSMRVPIPADKTGLVRVPAPPCEAAAAVSLDGRPVGALTVAPLDMTWEDGQRLGRADFLIDVSASRCYATTRYFYGPNASSSGDGPSTRWFERKALHALDHRVTNFFEKAPSSIQTFGGFGERTELLPIDCPLARP